MQHDVGEYLGFLLPRLDWISNMVTWSCRLQAEDGGLIHNAKSQAHEKVCIINPCRSCWGTGADRRSYMHWTQKLTIYFCRYLDFRCWKGVLCSSTVSHST